MRATKTTCQEREVTIDWDGEEGEAVEVLNQNVFQQVTRSKKVRLREEWHKQICGTEKAQDLFVEE